MMSFLKQKFAVVVFIFPFVVFLFFRLDLIFNDMSNSDAFRWHRRSAQFATALTSKNFDKTYQSYHPGVTLMWLSTGVEWGLKLHARLTNTTFKTFGNTDGYNVIDSVCKITLIFVLFFLLIIEFNLISLLFDNKVALLFVALSAIEPYYLGISRWYHLTALEVNLVFCAFLSLLVWAEFKLPKYAKYSGIFLGFAVLTKFSSLYVLPVFGLVFLATYLKDKSKTPNFYSKGFLSFGFWSVLIVVIFFPALWASAKSFEYVSTSILAAAVKSTVGNYGSVLFAEQHPYLFYPVVLLYKLSPITLILFLLTIIKMLLWRDKLLGQLVLLILVEISLYSISEQKIERYVLSLFPAILLICSVGLSRLPKSLFVPFSLSYIITFLLVFQTYRPIYSAYYSPLFGAASGAYKNGLYDDNGEFYKKAADYLNAKGRDTKAIAPYNIESFIPYFKGKITWPTFDFVDKYYLIMSLDSRREKPDTGPKCDKAEKTFNNVNLAVVAIFKCDYDPFIE